MYTIKGERYYNDYTRSNFEKTFSSLEDIFNWAKETSCNFTGEYDNYFADISKDKDGKTVGVGRISIKDYNFRGYVYWIYEISTSEGIVFANGRTTSGNKFCAKKIEEWLKDCDKRIKAIKTQPNFIEI